MCDHAVDDVVLVRHAAIRRLPIVGRLINELARLSHCIHYLQSAYYGSTRMELAAIIALLPTGQSFRAVRGT